MTRDQLLVELTRCVCEAQHPRGEELMREVEKRLCRDGWQPALIVRTETGLEITTEDESVLAGPLSRRMVAYR